MSQPCSICTHPQQRAIDQDLAGELSYRAIAQTYGCSKSAVLRHNQHRAPSLPQAVMEARAPRPDYTAVRQAMEAAQELMRNTAPTPGAMYRQLCSIVAVIDAVVQVLDPERHPPRGG